LTTPTLTVAAQPFNLILRANVAVTDAVTLANTGSVQLGGVESDDMYFAGGLVATAPSALSVAGTIRSSDQAILLGRSATTITLVNDTWINSGAGSLRLASSVTAGQEPYVLRLLSTGPTTIDGDLTSAGALSLAGPVTFSGASTITAPSMTFGGSVTAQGALTIHGATIINGGSVSSGTFTQTYDGTVDIGGAATSTTTFTGVGITFRGTLDATSRVLVNDSGATTYGGAIGLTHAPAHFETNAAGSSTFSGGTVRTSSPNSIYIADDAVVTTDTTFDTTNNGALTTGANITFAKTLNGTGNGLQAVTINAGTAGSVLVTGTIGNSAPLSTLTLTNSNGATFSSAVTTGTSVVLTDTTDGQVIRFAGNLSTPALTTFAQAYVLELLGSNTSIAGATQFLNTGALKLGDAAGDTLTFAGGLVATAPSSISLGGTVNTINTTMTLGDSGTPLTLVDHLTLNTAGGALNIGGAVNGTLANTQSLTLNAGSTGVVSVTGAVGQTTSLNTLKLVNSDGATFSSPVKADTQVWLFNTQAGRTVEFSDNLSTAALTTTANGYNVALLGTTTNVTGATEFLNTGTLKLGNAAGDTLTFAGGLVATAPSSISLGGTVNTTNTTMTLGDSGTPLTLVDHLTLNTSGGALNIGGAVNGTLANTQSLTLDAGNTGVVSITGAVGQTTSLNTLKLVNSYGATFSSPVTAATEMWLFNTQAGRTIEFADNLSTAALTTTANGYNVALLGTTTSVTGATQFLNTGTLKLGNAAGDSLTFTGGLVATAPSSISMGGTVNTTNTAMSLGDSNTPITLVDTVTLNSGTADMTLGGTVNGAVALQLNSTGKTTLGGVVGGSAALSSINTNTGGTLVIQGGRVVTSGIQSYGEDVLLDNSLRSTSLETTDSAVTFAGTLKNNTSTAEALTVTTGTGDVTLTGAVGAAGAGNAMGALAVHSAGDTTFTSTVDAASVTTNVGGRVVIKGGRITTSGAQSYGENAFLDNVSRATVLNTTDSAVSFAGTLKNNTANAEALTINAGTGAVTFTGAVGTTGVNNAIGALAVNSTGDTTFTSTVDATSVTTNTGGRVFIQGGRVTTSGVQSYGENVFLDNASRTTVLNTTDSAVTFAGTLKNNTSNAEALTITAGTGDVMFVGAVGTNAANGAIGALGITNTGTVTFTSTVDAASVYTATGSTLRIKGGRVTTTWSQWYGGDVLLDNALQSTTLTTTNSAVDFRGFVKNYAATPQSLTVNAGSGDVTFVGVAGVTGNALGDVVINSEGVTTIQSTVDAASLKTDVNGVNPITLGGRVVIQGGRISTSGEQHYAELVKLDKTDVSVNATTVLNTNGSAVTFDAAIKNTTAQAQNLTINASAGDVTFTGAVGATGASGPLGDVVVNSEGLTTFVRTVDAASLKTDVDTANINVNAATNKVTIQGGRITTTGEQHFAELVVLGNGSHATVLNTTNSNVAFDKAIVNASATAQDLTINAGTGSVTFTGAVGEDGSGVNGALGHLVINSAGETKFVSTVDAASLKTDVDTANINVSASTNKVTIQGGRITTTGEQHYAERAVLDNASHATVLNTTNSPVTFDKAIVNANTTAQDLTINAGTGNVTFTGAVGEDSNSVNGALGHVVINSAGETKFVSTVDAASLKTDVDTANINVNAATNKVTIQGGRITTTGEQHYAERVVLDNASHATVLNTTNSNVTFDKAIVNASATAQDLTINAGTGNVTFTGAVGEDAIVASLKNGALGDLVINSEGLTTFVSTVDAASLKTDLDTAHINVNAATNKVIIQGGRITTTGEQHFAELVVLGNGSHVTVLNTTNSPVTFDKAIVNASTTAQDLTINAGTSHVTFTGAVGEDSSGVHGPLGQLVVNSAGETKFVSTVDAASLMTDVDTANIDVNAVTNKVTIQGGRITTSR